MNQDNGGVIGKINTPTTLVASGVWSIQDQFEAQSSSTWPLTFPRTTFTNACRFNSDAYMVKNNESPTNQKKYTINVWVKRSVLSSRQRVFTVIDTSNTAAYSYLEFQSGDTINFDDFDGSSTRLTRTTNRVFKDISAWYNIIIAVDTTLSSASSRVKMYINGIEETSFSGTSNASQDFNTTTLNSSKTFRVGEHGTAGFRFGGYMTEFILVDGQTLDQTSFGATNPVTNIWEPKTYTGTYGNNGFKLTFADSSALGDDTSGNGNDFTVTSLASTDQSTDTCSNNFCTMNPLCRTNGSFSEGNLELDQNGSTGHTITSTFGVENGKWYWEAKLLNWNSSNSRPMIGVNTGRNSVTGSSEILGYSGDSDGIGYNLFGNNVYQNGSIIESSSDMGGSVADNDIYMFALDKDNNKFYIGRNGTFLNSGDPTTGSTGTGAIGTISSTKAYFPATGSNDNSSNSSHNNDWQFNFGSPVHSISSGNADANGFGNFEYAVPSGYFALNTKNLSEFG